MCEGSFTRRGGRKPKIRSGRTVSSDGPSTFDARPATALFRSPGVGRQRFDQNTHRCPVVEGEAGAVDEAETGAGAGNLGDQGRFAETHFAHALAKAFIPGEFAHTTSGANG